VAAEHQELSFVVIMGAFNQGWVDGVKQASINCMLPPVFVARVYGNPLLALFQVEHFNFANVTGAT
jgi:hypothetical protein